MTINQRHNLLGGRKNTMTKHRVAKSCVCCGSENLEMSSAILMPFIAFRVFGWSPVEITKDWGLSTIKTGHAYSLCNSLQCIDCGLVFLDIRFSETEMANLYSGYRGEKYSQERESFEPGYIERNTDLGSTFYHMNDIEDFLKGDLIFPIKILDWGGDTGKNTPFRHKSSSIDIFDISEKDVIPGVSRISREQLTLQHYDLIVCSHVLEHVSFPLDILLEIKSIMNKNTILYVEVPFEILMKNMAPNKASMKKHWHEHINFYSQESLRKLVESADLELGSIRAHEITNGVETKSIFQLKCKLK
jgi:hypothetical protein